MNSLLDNPCTTLSNTGSYTSWVADFSNSRCSRTVNNSYSSTVKRNSCWLKTNGWLSSSYTGYQCGDNNCAYIGAIYPIGTIFPEVNIPLYFPEVTCSFKEYLYSCPNGGTLSGTTCTKIDTEYKLFSSF